MLVAQVLDQFVFHHLEQAAGGGGQILLVAGLHHHPVGAGLGQGVVELFQLAHDRVGFRVKRDDADPPGKGLQFQLRFFQVDFGGVDLLFKELAGIAGRLQPAVHMHVDELVHRRVDHLRRQRRRDGIKRDLDQLAVAHRADGEQVFESLQRLVGGDLALGILVEETECAWGLFRADDGLQGVEEAAGLGLAGALAGGAVEGRVVAQIHPVDHPGCQLLALHELDLGLLELHAF